VRLDKYLVEEGYFESRNRANDAIKAGKVKVDGKVAKASTKIDENSSVDVEDEKFYVSRAARKLENFLSERPVEIKGKRALDIGSSTGGFAQILLENDVTGLYCVDVGKDQLHISLLNNEKLSLHEETDIRDFKSDNAFDLITCDVSFISILQIINDINRLSQEGTDIIILYKPQFEVGKDVKRDSRGVVLDKKAILEAEKKFIGKCESFDLKLLEKRDSEISGKNGNIETFLLFKMK
jgi:23S rRNA (cytidine1920-2'-O)/16S rRNA (cytidine1409-2'-O)-methyltransferase